MPPAFSPLMLDPALDDTLVEILLFDPDDIEESAVTGRFVRFSAPYERVEIEPQTQHRTFVRTVRRQPEANASWFDSPDDALVAIDDVASRDAGALWRWFVISLAAGAISLPAAWLLGHALPSFFTS